MKCLLVLALCLLAHSEITEENDVLVLTGDNFEEAIKNHKHILVEFYAPWCGHCKALAPEYEKAAAALKVEESDIKLGKVDATAEGNKALAETYEVQGYPTLKFFVDQEAKDYNGGRTESEIVAYLKKKTGDPFIVVSKVEEVNDEVTKSSFVILGAFKDRTSESGKTFIDVASSNDDTLFIITDNDEVMKEFNLVDGGIAAVRNFADEEPIVVMDGDKTDDSIREFIQKHQLPLVIEFSDETAPKIFGGDVKSHYLLFADKTNEGHAKLMTTFREVSKAYSGKLIHVLVNTDVEDNERILEFFGLKKEDGTSARIINLDGDMKKFAPDSDFTKSDDITVEDMSDFAKRYLAGELEPHMMSEEIPEDWDAKPVKVLVGKNFEEVALDEHKNVLVEFYAPWCGHCKQLEPIYEELAQKFEGKPNVIIAKMDATANEVKKVTVQGFPTIKFFPMGSEGKMVNVKARTLEELTAFLESDPKDMPEDDGLDEDDEEEEDFGEDDEEFGDEEFDDDSTDDDDDDDDIIAPPEDERDEL